MSIVLPVFTPIEETLYLTLCGRALDNHLAQPILGDTMAEQLVRRLGYDCGRFRLSASPIINIAHRAKKLDQVARGFIDRHPNAVGLDLGAGLDTRVFRLDPPAGVDWYDVDYPEVITARRQLLPQRAHAHGIGADLTDPGWLDPVPGDRPAVIVADGLMAFLTQDDMVALLRRLIGHFPSGEVAFNGYSPVRHLGGQGLPRHPVGRRPHPLPRLRRPPPTRTLGPQAAPGQGDPAHPRARGRPVPAGPALVHPPFRPQHRLVTERDHRPALPLLVVQQRSRS
jgi:O-methyltransferase involved in polyketide biosynthesis